MRDHQIEAGENSADTINDGMDGVELDISLPNYAEEMESMDSDTLMKALWDADSQFTQDDEPEDTGQVSKEESNPIENTDGKRIRRVSVNGVEQHLAIEMAKVAELLRTGKATDTLDALEQIRGIDLKPKTNSEQTQRQTQEEKEVAEPTTLESELAELREQHNQAEDDFDTAETRRLNLLIQDKILELAEERAEAKLLKKEVQKTANDYESVYEANLDMLEEMYSELSDDNSLFVQLLDDRIEAAKSRKDPALKDPNFILQFANSLAESLKTTARKPSKPTPPPIRFTKPIGSSLAPGHSSPVQMTESQAAHLINNSSLEDLGAALFS